jgi:hypothetical protein
MSRLCAYALLLVSLASTVTADEAAFAKALADAGTRDFTSSCDDTSSHPESVVCRAVSNDASAKAAIATIARALSVSPDTASVIGTALLPRLMAADEQALAAPIYESSRAMLEAALQHESNQTPILIAMAQLNKFGDASRYTALLPLIRKQADAASAAVDVAVAFEDAETSQIFLLDAFSRYPDDADLIDAIGSRSYNDYVDAVFGPVVLTTRGAELRKRQHPLATNFLAERATWQLTALSNLGLADEMVAVFNALPDDAQQQISREADRYNDIRLDVAAATIVSGTPELAHGFAAALKQKAAPDHDHEAAFRKLLSAALSEEKEELFDLIIALVSNDSMPVRGVRARLFASMLEQQGYPALAAEILRDAKSFRTVYSIPDAYAPHVQDVIARASALDIPEPAQTSAANARLTAARLVPFTERPLPKPTASSEATIIDCSDAAKVAASTNLPPYIRPIRMERNGNDLVAITISSAVDPAGEVALGGYWVVRSHDGGQTWSEYYTGLRQNLPYVISPASRLPLMDGDRLRIEVEVQELDTNSITFPPVALRLARTQKNLYLDIPWEELTRDSDGDSLTDLLEERIVTDPHDADTDGDAMPDADDGMPQVAYSSGGGLEAEVLGTVLEGFSLGGGRIVPGIADASDSSCAVGTSASGQSTLFLIGARSSFAPFTVEGRAIVLTQDELTAYTEKFGPIYPAQIRHFVIDHSGTRAIVELDQRWSGTTYLLTKTKDGWKSTMISMWIT